MHVLPSAFPLTSVCTLLISFSSPRPLTWNISLFLSRRDPAFGDDTLQKVFVCVWEIACMDLLVNPSSVLHSHPAPELSREFLLWLLLQLSPATNIQMVIKQKNNRLEFQKLRPSSCGSVVDRWTHPQSVCHRELARLHHNNIFIIWAEPV